MTPRPLITAMDICAVEDQMETLWIGRGKRVAELEAQRCLYATDAAEAEYQERAKAAFRDAQNGR